MKFNNIKNLLKLILIDFIAVLISFSAAKYFFNIVTYYYELIQSFTANLNKIDLTIQTNASSLEYNSLMQNLEVINNLSTKIIFYLSILSIIIFSTYLISQSIKWNLILNNFRLKSFKTYLKKFTLISIPIMLILSYSLFNLVVRLKPFILDLWFESIFNNKSFSIIFLLFILVLTLIYTSFCLSILINKHKIKESFNLLLTKQVFKNLIKFILLFISSTLISVFIVRINPKSIILIMISITSFLMLINIFKLYLANKLEKI